jgi:DNA-binding GntR family transcriptional regulator
MTIEQRVDGVELAHRKLRSAILRGELEAGVEVSQVALARDLQIGRTPLREALRMLQREGLIETERHRQIRIAPFSLLDLEHLYAMRIVLESFAVQQTVPRMDDADLDELQSLLVQMDERAQERDVAGWELPHRSFHRLLVRHAGVRLERTVQELCEHSERYRRVYVAQGPRAWSIGSGEHAEIVEACVARDAPAAGERLALHLSKTALTVVMLVAPEHDPTVVRAAIQSMVTRG